MVKIELNSEGVRALLRSQEMRQICEEHAQETLSGCGDGYEADSYVGVNRVNAMVFASTQEAVKDNLKNNTILRALK